MRRAHAAALALALAVTLPAQSARADGDPAGAQFEIGLAAMKAEHYDTACPAFAESYRLEPKAGVVFTLAECEAKWGKVASAIVHYQTYLDAYARLKPDEQARQGKRPEIAQTQKRSLEQDVPRLTLTLAPTAAPGTSVVLDNVALEASKLGTPLPMDPGEHSVAVHKTDGSSEQLKVSLAIRERRTLELAAATATGANNVAATSQPTPAAEGQDGGGRSPVPLIAAIGIGVVGIGLGSVTGLLASGKTSTIDEHCIDTKCDAAGKQAGDDAKQLALISTISFGVGIVGAATAVVLMLTAPSKPSAPTAARAARWQPQLAVTPGTGGMVGVGRAF